MSDNKLFAIFNFNKTTSSSTITNYIIALSKQFKLDPHHTLQETNFVSVNPLSR